jgi:hypothetical protein
VVKLHIIFNDNNIYIIIELAGNKIDKFKYSQISEPELETSAKINETKFINKHLH